MGNNCCSLDNKYRLLGNYYRSLDNNYRPLGNNCRSLDNKYRSLGNNCRSLGNKYRPLGNYCRSLDNYYSLLGNNCRSLSNYYRSQDKVVNSFNFYGRRSLFLNNQVMKLLSKFIFWVSGWKIEGKVPPLKKFVAIGAPHTSAWDLVYGRCGCYLLDMPISFLAKKEAFWFPIGILLRALGAIPVDRASSHNVVQQAVKMFQNKEQFVLALAPEGTREYAPKWRTGFYYIALQVNVPIILGYLDYKRKVVGIGPTFYPTDNVDADIETIKNFYKPIQGKHPEKGVR